MIEQLLSQLPHILMWGFFAACAMACIQEGSQAAGISRMSFPFLIGTFFTGNRRHAQWIGFLCYMLGGCLYAVAYKIVFLLLERSDWWLGALLGLFQGVFMLVVILPLLPSIHPRMASPYDGPEAARRIESPGFIALHYGPQAPIIHLIGQAVFGAMLGAAF